MSKSEKLSVLSRAILLGATIAAAPHAAQADTALNAAVNAKTPVEVISFIVNNPNSPQIANLVASLPRETLAALPPDVIAGLSPNVKWKIREMQARNVRNGGAPNGSAQMAQNRVSERASDNVPQIAQKHALPHLY